MSVSKKLRQTVYNKYSGLCGYTGKPLDESWQVDHITPASSYYISKDVINDVNNLLPTIRIINHYKRGKDLEMFRQYILKLHIRLSKLPKKTIVERTIKRKLYLLEVANYFDITENKPFSGIFYFETLNT